MFIFCLFISAHDGFSYLHIYWCWHMCHVFRTTVCISVLTWSTIHHNIELQFLSFKTRKKELNFNIEFKFLWKKENRSMKLIADERLDNSWTLRRLRNCPPCIWTLRSVRNCPPWCAQRHISRSAAHMLCVKVKLKVKYTKASIPTMHWFQNASQLSWQ